MESPKAYPAEGEVSPKAYPAEGVDLMIFAEGVDLRPELEIAISFDSDVLRRWFLRNWKAENLSFRSLFESASEDIAIESYGELGS